MKFVCQICGYIYDEAKEGTAFADLPDSWVCPLCKAAKSAFKCIGCGACAEACPSGAISIVPAEYPPQQAKDERVVALANQLIKSKVQQEKIAERIANETELDGLSRLAAAIAKSSRLVAEDISRESGYMLPQSKNAHDRLKEWLEHPASEEFPREAARKLLDNIKCNE